MPDTGTPPLPSPPAPVWCEVGRPSPGEAQDWTTWVSPLGDGGALYRSLVLADGAIAVAVELHSRGASVPRTVHRGRCGLPRDPHQAAERVRLLLAAADRAASKALLEAHRGEGAAAGRAMPSSRRVPDDDTPRGEGREEGVSAAPRGHEGRIREQPRRETATAA